MVFHKKSYTFDVLFNNKDEMLDLKQLTVEVCRIATEAGHFLKEERKNFRRERVMEKHAHDYVSYVDKESEVRLVKALSALLPEAGFITEEGSATYQDEPYCWVIDPLDGTTNYILTKMTKDHMEFADALALATELGYAEADPTADVEGYDAARKVAIMASIAFNSRVTFSDVYTQGITKITAADIAYATEMGMVIKLLGVARNTDTGIEAGVYPMLIPADHPLAGVNDSFNAVFVHGDAVDDAMFQGRGAGKLPTGSAVAGDIFEVARDIVAGSTGRINCTCYKNLRIKPVDEVQNRYFMRMEVEDRPGVLAAIASVFGNNHVSIAQVIQKSVGEGTAELVIITDQVEERHFKDALLVMNEMSIVKEIPSVLRVYAQSE